MANQKLKLLFLFQILLDNTDEKHGLSSEEIMTLLQEKGIHVERKTLYKDIEALKEYDVDIIKENAGKNVLYYIGNRKFELPELKLMVDAVQSSRFITTQKSKNLIKKLQRALKLIHAEGEVTGV